MPAAQELDADSLPHLVELAQEDGPHLPGGAHVGPAARAAVEPIDGNDAQGAFAVRGFAQPLCLGRIFVVHPDGTVLKDDVVGPPLGVENGARLQGAAFEIDAGTLRAQMEAHGMQSEPLFEHGREQMLAGVLLHVIEAAAPIDGALHRLAIERPDEVVRDALPFVGDVQHRDAGDGPGVAGLAPGSGIKRGAVEVDGAPVRGAFQDARGELAQVGIGVIEAFGHGDTAIVADGECGCATPARSGTVERLVAFASARSSVG